LDETAVSFIGGCLVVCFLLAFMLYYDDIFISGFERGSNQFCREPTVKFDPTARTAVVGPLRPLPLSLKGGAKAGHKGFICLGPKALRGPEAPGAPGASPPPEG
jgi:hypothetical protein